MAQAITVNRVVAFIKDHGVGCFVRDGQIFAEDVYTLNGEIQSEWKVIEPTVAAAREFLNY